MPFWGGRLPDGYTVRAWTLSASEKIVSFPGRLSFFVTLCYFLRVLFGSKEIFRIFANGWADVIIAHLENINAKKLLILRNALKLIMCDGEDDLVVWQKKI